MFKNTNKIYNILENYNVENISIINDSQNLEYINKKISKIYVINLINDNFRKNYIKIIMKKMNINYNLVHVNKIDYSPSYDISNSEYGCYLSHLWCLNDAKNNNYKEIIIFEDDIIFHKNFKQMFYNLFTNSSYDLVMLGAFDKFFSTLNYRNVQNNIYYPKCKFILGAHAIYYSQKAIEYTLTYKNNNKIVAFDLDFINIFKYFNKTAAICYPNLVVAELSTTNINHNYSFLNEKKEYYYYSKTQINFNFNDYYFIYLCFFQKKYQILFDDNITFEEYIDSILEDDYKDNLIRKNEIKNRIDFTFFTNEDFKMILLSE